MSARSPRVDDPDRGRHRHSQHLGPRSHGHRQRREDARGCIPGPIRARARDQSRPRCAGSRPRVPPPGGDDARLSRRNRRRPVPRARAGGNPAAAPRRPRTAHARARGGTVGGLDHVFRPAGAHGRSPASLGQEGFLAVEQAVVREEDAARARELARPYVAFYSGADNYRRNLLRLGWTEAEIENAGTSSSTRLVAHGSDEAIASRVQAQFDAGADHVASRHCRARIRSSSSSGSWRRCFETCDVRSRRHLQFATWLTRSTWW